MSFPETILKVEEVNFSYNDYQKTLSNISFSVSRGELLGIIGPNGSGKTTLLKIISGILKPGKGNIFLLGENLNKFSIKKISKFVSVVPQDTWIAFNFKAKEVVFMGRIPYISRIKGETIEDYRISREAMVKTQSLPLSEKNIQKIILNPGTGKPLKYELAGLLSIRVAKSRLIYEVRNDTIILHKFEHRKSVYKPS